MTEFKIDESSSICYSKVIVNGVAVKMQVFGEVYNTRKGYYCWNFRLERKSHRKVIEDLPAELKGKLTHDDIDNIQDALAVYLYGKDCGMCM